jgi:hypothetical protein
MNYKKYQMETKGTEIEKFFHFLFVDDLIHSYVIDSMLRVVREGISSFLQSTTKLFVNNNLFHIIEKREKSS